jgi:hypothetical protein
MIAIRGVISSSAAKTYVDDPVIVTVKCLDQLGLLVKQIPWYFIPYPDASE